MSRLNSPFSPFPAENAPARYYGPLYTHWPWGEPHQLYSEEEIAKKTKHIVSRDFVRVQPTAWDSYGIDGYGAVRHRQHRLKLDGSMVVEVLYN